MSKRVIIADDDADTRMSYSDLVLDLAPDTTIVQVERGSDLVRRVLEGCDFAITDNDMLDGRDAGIAAIKEIRAAGCTAPIYFLSGRDATLPEAIAFGATGAFLKTKMDYDTFSSILRTHLD